ncbi:NAD(+)/NADH kinase [Desulfoprunum benzoelyticum]|uniref:NAD kinase n=1 Tax=Desulfoprunum benzoelyticum TaxID=1506996 RepID=A0A840USL7_9BACT|nr:NAD(+)/NADH kinase [Desulfoprunum benzoelyticum]MBB5346364.1 NAD+ kinase [Desulfoprunum benzoelyticum]MBM9528637.1 NAD(+)/NADH kinase [Desulfoprunum benzoelyticum]
MSDFYPPVRILPSITIRRAGIITKPDDQESAEYAGRLGEWFGKRQIETTVDCITSDLDILIVLGGDGTLLHIAENAALHAIPVVGINLGYLGFLTEFTATETENVLHSLLAGPVTIENRQMLRVRLLSGGVSSGNRYALNEVVINKKAEDRLLNLASRADNNTITTYKADGLIFSTPTGSTAYNLSAGGPLVHPGLAAILVTPICPFMLGSRPIILPADRIITTSFDSRSDSARAKIIVDGQPTWDMRQGDILEIKSASLPLRLVTSARRDYFSILRTKLHWGFQGTPNRD